MGQIDSDSIIIESKDDLDKLDFSKDIHLFSQTTKPLEGFKEIASIIKNKMLEGTNFESFDTICRQVSNRVPNMKEFAKKHDLILFIAGEKSSNGKVLFEECKTQSQLSFHS